MQRITRTLVAVASVATTILGAGSSASAASVCDSTFHHVRSPGGSGKTILYDVDAASPSDAWAVGKQGTTAFSLHWNGMRWRRVPVPMFGAKEHLNAVALAGPEDAWAVGLTQGSGGRHRSLVLHRTIGGWIRVSAPNGPLSTDLDEISVVGPDDIWAAGTTTAHGSHRAFVIHWNGVRWNVVAGPPAVSTFDHVEGLAAVGPDDVWALFQYISPNHHDRATTFHWTGAGWDRVGVPQPANTHVLPMALLALGPSSLWMVGYMEGTTVAPLLEHWNGERWVRFDGVQHSGPSSLTALAALGPHDVYAFGVDVVGTNDHMFVERFDGARWTQVRTETPASSNFNRLQGASAAAAGSVRRVWAVGSSGETDMVPLIEDSCP